jgi:hypothetical protein
MPDFRLEKYQTPPKRENELRFKQNTKTGEKKINKNKTNKTIITGNHIIDLIQEIKIC